MSLQQLWGNRKRPGFIFGGNTDLTYEDLQAMRKSAEQAGAQTSVGGFHGLANGLVAGILNNRARKGEQAGREKFNEQFNAIFGNMAGNGFSASPTSNAVHTASPGATSGALSATNAVHTASPDQTRSVLRDAMVRDGGSTLTTAESLNGSQPVLPDRPRSPLLDLRTGPVNFERYEANYGLPSGYLGRTAQLESSMGKNMDNPNSSAGGPFQFIDSTARQYGLTNKYDWAQSTDAASRLARDNMAILSRALGRSPTGAELYLAHQQGAGGAAKLLSNPNARAADVVGADAVRLNGGDANMSAGQFANIWLNKFNRTSGGSAPSAPAQGGGGALNGSIMQLAQLASSPYANDGQKAVMQLMLQRMINASQPPNPMDAINLQRAQLGLEKDQIEIDQMRNPERKVIKGADGFNYYQDTGERVLPNVGAPPGYRQITGDEADRMGLDPAQVYNMSPDGQITPIKSGVTVNNNLGGENAFDKETGKILAQEAGQIVESGMNAQRNLGRLITLEQALESTSQGIQGGLRGFAAGWGIKTEGASDIEVANAIINQLVPEQRAPGSGDMSDKDLELFKQSLPRLINTPEGNRKIISTMRAIAEYDVARMQIARQHQLGQINAQQAYEAYMNLGNPLAEWAGGAAMQADGDSGWQDLGNGVRIRRKQ